jgi:ABC-type amino acid transport substrate-binding protein
LAVGHLDALLAIKESAELIITKKSLSDKVEVLVTPLVTNSTYIAFSKKSDKRALIQRINRTIKAIRRSGSYDKVLHDIISVESVKAD